MQSQRTLAGPLVPAGTNWFGDVTMAVGKVPDFDIGVAVFRLMLVYVFKLTICPYCNRSLMVTFPIFVLKMLVLV